MNIAANSKAYDRYLDIPFPDYLADHSHVSNSMLKRLGQSPAHLQAYINDEANKVPTKAQIDGRVAHAKVLEPDTFDQNFYVIPDDLKKPTSVQLNAAKPSAASIKTMELWSEMLEIADGRELVRESDLDGYEAMRSVLMDIPKIKALLSNGKAEQTRYFIDTETGVRCKMRADFVHGSQQNVIVDYKTCEDARPAAFARSVINYSYDLQANHYKVGGQAEYFYIIAQEKSPPYAAKLYLITSDWLQRGGTLRREYLNTYAECLASGIWPAYDTETDTLELPHWAEI